MLISRHTSIRNRANKHNLKDKKDEDKKNESTIFLYGDIGGWMGIDAQEWVKELNALTADTIHVRVDSGGGDIFAARAMKTAIMQHKAKIIAHVDGLAASAASFFIMGADEIEIVDGGFLMIHKAMSMIDILGYFNEDDLAELCEDMQKEMALHGKINESIANDYAKKTKKKCAELLTMMDEETWMNAQEALDNGFVDRIYDGDVVEGSYDFSIYNKVPEILKGRGQVMGKRAAEKALRDAGFSNKQAKDFVAKAFKDEATGSAPVVNQELVPVIQRDVEIATQRDVVDEPIIDKIPNALKPKKDRIAELLTRAEIIAPSID